MRADAAAAFSCRNRSSSSGRVARGSSSSAVRVELSGGRFGDDGVFNQSWKDRGMDNLYIHSNRDFSDKSEENKK